MIAIIHVHHGASLNCDNNTDPLDTSSGSLTFLGPNTIAPNRMMAIGIINPTMRRK